MSHNVRVSPLAGRPMPRRPCHPEDLQHRLDVIAEIRALRIATGLSGRDLARARGITMDALGQLERGHRKNPHIATIQWYASAVGATCHLAVTGVPGGDHPDVAAALSLANGTADPDQADRWFRSACAAHLTAARKAADITTRQLAATASVSQRSVWQWESEIKPSPLMSTYQRWARAVGGRFRIDITEAQ